MADCQCRVALGALFGWMQIEHHLSRYSIWRRSVNSPKDGGRHKGSAEDSRQSRDRSQQETVANEEEIASLNRNA